MMKLAENPVLADLHARLPKIIRKRYQDIARKRRQRSRDRAAGFASDAQAINARKGEGH